MNFNNIQIVSDSINRHKAKIYTSLVGFVSIFNINYLFTIKFTIYVIVFFSDNEYIFIGLLMKIYGNKIQ